MGGLLEGIVGRTKTCTVPKPENKVVRILLGVTNFFLFGIGTIIAGAMENSGADVIIGIMQLFIPLVGWIWSWVWGTLMILNK